MIDIIHQFWITAFAILITISIFSKGIYQVIATICALIAIAIMIAVFVIEGNLIMSIATLLLLPIWTEHLIKQLKEKK